MKAIQCFSRVGAFSFLALSLFGQSQTVTYQYTGAPLPIFRDSADITTIADVFVPVALTIQSVRITINIEYPRPGDLNIFLFSPAGTRTKLLERNCGNNGTLRDISFEDIASNRYADACPTVTGGTWRGNEPLANSQGQVAFGRWRLAVENNGSNDYIGRVVGVRIAITGSPTVVVPTTSSDAIFSSTTYGNAGTFAPGDLINVVGVGLGPAGGQTAPAGDLPRALGGTQATIGGRPVAFQFTSFSVLTLQIPYDIPGGEQQMVFNYNGTSGSPVTVNVVTTNPGIVTKSGLAAGDASVTNQNGQVNGPTARAAKGSIVAFYTTGLGTLNPQLSTGQSPPGSPLSETTNPVSAVINGNSAPVWFAGAAPGLPGLYQVNVEVGQSVPSGYVYVTLFANGVPTQSNVGIWVE